MIWIPEVSRIAGGRDTVEMGPATQAFEIVLPVEPADLDQLRHVNNVTYLRWVQEAAVAHWTAVASAADQAKVLWIVLRHEIDYLQPAFLGDGIVARTWVGRSEEHTSELQLPCNLVCRLLLEKKKKKETKKERTIATYGYDQNVTSASRYSPRSVQFSTYCLLFHMSLPGFFFFFFFFNDTATTEIYTLSLHDALPISLSSSACTTARPTPEPASA